MRRVVPKIACLLLALVGVAAGAGLVLGGSLGGRVKAANLDEFPDPLKNSEGKYHYVNDFASVLSNDDKLDILLDDFAKEDSTQIVVIVVNDLPDDTTIYDFVPRLADSNPKWAAGQDEYDNGVIFTVVMNSREMAIDVGYGLEGTLTDIESRHILDYEVKPYFQSDDYDGGVEAGVNAIMLAVKGEYSADDVDGEGVTSVLGSIGSVCCFMGVFTIVPWLAAFLGRTKSWWLGGVIGFVAALVLAGLMAALGGGLGGFRFAGFICFPPVLTIVGLVFDFVVSKTYKVRKSRGLATGLLASRGGFWGGGSSGSSGSSFGGFSSGGGSFGGGGSRSSW